MKKQYQRILREVIQVRQPLECQDTYIDIEGFIEFCRGTPEDRLFTKPRGIPESYPNYSIQLPSMDIINIYMYSIRY